MSSSDNTLGKEFWVGVFVTTGIALFIFFLFFYGGMNHVFNPTKTIQVQFDYLGGLKSEQPVLYAGYQVGTVQSIEIHRDSSKLTAHLSIPTDIPIYKNSEILISSSGLIGDKVVEILPPENPGDIVKSGETIQGESPINMAQMLGRFRKLFNEQANLDIESLVNNANSITDNFVTVSKTIKNMMSENKNNVKRMIDDLARSSGKVDHLVDRVDTTVVSIQNFTKQLSDMSSNNRKDLRKSIQNLRKTSTELRKIISKNSSKINNISSNLNRSSDSLPLLIERADTTAQSLQIFADRLSKTTKKNNPEVQTMIQNLEQTSKNLQVFTRKIRKKPWNIIWSTE